MKKIRLLLLAFFAVAMMASCSNNSTTVESDEETAEAVEEDNSASEDEQSSESGTAYALDAASSSITWEGEKLTGKHNGTIDVRSGNVQISEGELVGGMVSIDMTTIAVTDLTEETGAGKLKGHLSGADFFDIASFPISVFKINSVMEGGDGNATHTLSGELTIKGKTAEIMVPAVVSMADGKIMLDGSAKIDRTVFGIEYKSKKFFPELKDKFIYDEFVIGFKVSANI